MGMWCALGRALSQVDLCWLGGLTRRRCTSTWPTMAIATYIEKCFETPKVSASFQKRLSASTLFHNESRKQQLFGSSLRAIV